MFLNSKSNVFEYEKQKMTFYEVGSGADDAFIWAHGWGRDHSSMVSIASSFLGQGKHYFIDFPGFGGSQRPVGDWCTSDYARFINEFIRSIDAKRKFWISHSFGCRVGIKICAMYPNILDALVLIAAPGLDMRSRARKAFLYSKVACLKFAKAVVRIPALVEFAKGFIGSRDYRNSSSMRNILLNVIDEDLRGDASKIMQKVLLIYGQNDVETNQEMGRKFLLYIRNSDIIILDGLDHSTILTSGCHKVSYCIKRFLTKNDFR